MKNFTFEDGCFYCNKDDGNILHEIHIEIKALIGYDVEFGRIQNPNIIRKSLDNYLYLVCSCGEFEDISGEFMIEDDYIKSKEEITFPKQWIAKVGNKYVQYIFGKTVVLTDDITKSTIMNEINKNIINTNVPSYAEYEPEYGNIEWIEIKVNL